jgi:hypothetical protein
MEILIFALGAAYNRHRPQERVVAEPEEFQPFDLQALRNPAKAEPPGQWQSGLNVPGDNCPFPVEANG